MAKGKAGPRETIGATAARESAYWQWVNSRRKQSITSVRKEEREAQERTRRYEMWGYMRWALDTYPGKFTPVMREALELVYQQGLSVRKSASVAGVSRRAFRDRLAGAHRALRQIILAEARAPQDDGVVRRPSEVRRGKNEGRAKL
jgi:DNA-directed RNA polymerase specialized sigma24 family protein